jgi:hypothetical protein
MARKNALHAVPTLTATASGHLAHHVHGITGQKPLRGNALRIQMLRRWLQQPLKQRLRLLIAQQANLDGRLFRI